MVLQKIDIVHRRTRRRFSPLRFFATPFRPLPAAYDREGDVRVYRSDVIIVHIIYIIHDNIIDKYESRDCDGDGGPRGLLLPAHSSAAEGLHNI